MKKPTIKCPLCERNITTNNYKSHIRRHEIHPESFIEPKYKITHDGLTCQFCSKVCKNSNSLCNHERLCNSNPNNQLKYSGITKFNENVRSGNRIIWNKGLTKDTNDSVRKQSESLSTWYKNNPNHSSGGYIPTSARKCKYGTYRGYYCDSGWELAFLIYHLDMGSDVRRCDEYFEYEYEGIIHKYYPDFIIENTYYEIKGIYRPEDPFKIAQFPKDKNLLVVDRTSISAYINHCKQHYGKMYTTLYDRNYPSWMDKEDSSKEYNFKVANMCP